MTTPFTFSLLYRQECKRCIDTYRIVLTSVWGWGDVFTKYLSPDGRAYVKHFQSSDYEDIDDRIITLNATYSFPQNNGVTIMELDHLIWALFDHGGGRVATYNRADGPHIVTIPRPACGA